MGHLGFLLMALLGSGHGLHAPLTSGAMGFSDINLFAGSSLKADDGPAVSIAHLFSLHR